MILRGGEAWPIPSVSYAEDRWFESSLRNQNSFAWSSLLFSVICTVDVFLLKQMLGLLRWGTEWLSLKRVWMERGMIVGYSACFIGNTVFGLHGDIQHRSRNLEFSAMVCCIALYLLICQWMWRRQKLSEAERVRRLLSMEGMASRIYALLLAVLFSLLELAPPRRWYDVLVPAGFGFYVAFEYAISLPEDGERGRKRKLALAKLKEMFGTSWITAPVPQPQ